MKNLGILLMSLALGCATSAGTERVPEKTPEKVLEKVPALGESYPIPQFANHLMTASAQMWPYETVKVEGIVYDVASNRQGRVAYIGTSDPAFKTPEGLSVGATLAEVTATGAKAPWAEPGWAYHTELPSGWEAAFVVGCEMTGGPLQPNSKVAWFFKRD